MSDRRCPPQSMPSCESFFVVRLIEVGNRCVCDLWFESWHGRGFGVRICEAIYGSEHGLGIGSGSGLEACRSCRCEEDLDEVANRNCVDWSFTSAPGYTTATYPRATALRAHRRWFVCVRKRGNCFPFSVPPLGTHRRRELLSLFKHSMGK